MRSAPCGFTAVTGLPSVRQLLPERGVDCGGMSAWIEAGENRLHLAEQPLRSAAKLERPVTAGEEIARQQNLNQKHVVEHGHRLVRCGNTERGTGRVVLHADVEDG